MARQTKRKGTDNAQFRKRVPLSLLPIIRGKLFSVYLPETTAPDSPTFAVTTTISAEIVFSLRTPEGRLSTVRHASALRQVEAYFDAVARGPQELSHEAINGILGIIYRQLVAEHEANPPALYKPGHDDSPEEIWSEFDPWYDIIQQADELIGYRTSQSKRSAVQVLRPILDLDSFLASKAIILTESSYEKLVDELPRTVSKVISTLMGRARGDYSEDLVAKQFAAPPNALPKTHSATGVVRTFDDLFDRWKAEVQPAASTISTWRGYIKRFTAFLGHDDPHRVKRPDALGWKDSLVREDKKKINTTYLAALNTIYRFGLENAETTGITSNPFANVKAKQKKKAGTSVEPFTSQEVALILRSARSEAPAYLRWIPWLQASIGARVAEVAQLWGSSVVTVDGVPCIKISPAPDGGSLKNEGSERTVPIHPALIEDGFLEFAKSRGRGPLFYGGRVGKTATKLREDQKHPSKGVANRLGAWVREIGVTDKRKAPTHSWRHWFKTALSRAGVETRLIDAIQGHANSEDAAGYYHPTPSDMLYAISKLDLRALAKGPPQAPESP